MSSVLANFLSGTQDPSSVATFGNQGDVFARIGVSGGTLYQKQDSGSTTNWALLAANTNPTNSFWCGYTDAAASWNTTSAIFVDGTNAGGNTLTTRESNGISVAASAGNEAGILFTPASVTATYLFKASFPGQGASNGAVGAFQLVAGAIPITTASNQASSSGLLEQVTLEGIYTPGVANPLTVKIQIAAIGGGTTSIQDVTGGLVPVIEWTIIRIK